MKDRVVWFLLMIMTFVFVGCGQVQEEKTATFDSQENMFSSLPDHFTIGWANETSEYKDLELGEAISFWNASLGYEFISYDEQDPDFTVNIGEFPDQEMDGHSLIKGPNKEIWCIVTIKREEAWPLFAHEIGHCLGFAHANNPDSIMFADTDAGQVVTESIKEILKSLMQTL